MTKFYTLLLFVLLTSVSFAQITIQDDDLQGGQEYTWTADNEYLLDGYVYLEEDGVLNIEPGTVIKGKATPTTGNAASALIITRGAQIFAEGTKDNPVIFTAEVDDLSNDSDLTKDDKGLWGGLIILGNGVVAVDGGEGNIEGIPSTTVAAVYGGNDNADNSGTLKYVSIRHGGSVLDADNEINGLTMGGVGSETEIDYVEVFANSDDGIEWFGGAVSVKHAVTAFCGDDSYDYDQSWAGNGQYWFTIQDENSNRAGEWDGAESTDLLPESSPMISNATFIGGGATTVNGDGNDALRIRDNGAVNLYNSLLIDFVDGAIVIDNDFDGDSYDRLVDGDFSFGKNVFFDIKGGSDIPSVISVDGGDINELLDLLVGGGSTYVDPVIGGISRQTDGGLDPRTSAAELNYNAAASLVDDFFDEVDYIGAFANTQNYSEDNWATGWTALDEYGFFGDLATVNNNNIKVEVAELDLYPNPTVDAITITSDKLVETATVAIYNVQGMLVASQKIDNNISTTTINVNNLPAGNYVAAVFNKGAVTATATFVKK